MLTARIGFNKQLRRSNSLGARKSEFVSAIRQDFLIEKTPYAPPTFISKGTLITNLGGLLEVKDTTGGTTLFTANPDTGTVTISGPLQAQTTLNLGTINDSAIGGTATLIGTLTNNSLISGGTISSGTINNSVIGTAAITGGTVNSAVVGSPSITGGTVNSVVVGSPSITGGTMNNAVFGTPAITGGTGNALTLGSPSIINGTMNNATFGTPNTQSGTLGTPTIIRPTIDGTSNFDINAGSAALGANGDFAIQTHTGSAIIAIRHGGTTFYFVSAGTL